MMATIKDHEHDYFMNNGNIQVRRDYVVEDAYHAIILGKKNPKSVFRIQFRDSEGGVEAGIDGGGLFKEFMTLVTRQIFDPQYTFFLETGRERHLYPNPLSEETPNYKEFFRLFGILVGKAIYEGVLLKCHFAKFFLNHFVNKSNQVDDLQALDS
jgi:ubiquitin-protein ligase E3 C